MKIYLASIEKKPLLFLLRVAGAVLFSYYDLSDNCPLPFRKESWNLIINLQGDNNANSKTTID